MARPRVFVSSTYFDLRHVRAGLSVFLAELGYESVMFEMGDIYFAHDESIEKSCYRAVEECDILLLIIGGRFGAPSEFGKGRGKKSDLDGALEKQRSVTQREYETALERGIPTFVFVERGVFAELATFKKNRENSSVKYAHVDDVRIFELVDDIVERKTGNFVREFDSLDDITSWLRDQIAGMFLKLLREQSAREEIQHISAQITDLRAVVQSLKTYAEAIVRSVNVEGSEQVIDQVKVDLEKDKRSAEVASRSALFRWLVRNTEDENKVDLLKALNESTDFDDLMDLLRKAGVSDGLLKRMRMMSGPRRDYPALKALLSEEP